MGKRTFQSPNWFVFKCQILRIALPSGNLIYLFVREKIIWKDPVMIWDKVQKLQEEKETNHDGCPES
jgi:hypothetical protein